MSNLCLTDLSKKDALESLEIISMCLSCKDENSFSMIINKLKNLTGFDAASLVSVNLSELFKSSEMFDSNHYMIFDGPLALYDEYMENAYYKIDTAIQAFTLEHGLYNYTDVTNRFHNGVPNALDYLSRDYNYPDGWIHGIQNEGPFNRCILVNFFGQYIENNKRNHGILNAVSPHVCMGYAKHIKKAIASEVNVTKRELEVLNWLKEGKTTWEISVILGIGLRGVRFHIDNLKIKFNAVNRAQMVAEAMSKGIINLS